jgi:hypothetical protein
VISLGVEMECSAIFSLDLRDRLSGVWLEGDSTMVEALRRAVRDCSGLRFRRGTSLVMSDDGAGVDGLICSPLPGGRGWWCGVSCVFVLVRRFVCVVVFDSVCYVPIASPQMT